MALYHSTDSLWELIQALTKAEVERLKARSSLYRRSAIPEYVILFDAIRKQKVYDEEKLKRKFADHGFVRYFPKIKNYLYNAVLEAIMDLKTEKKSGVHGLIGIIWLLFEKGLLSQIPPILSKAVILAEDHEDFESLIELLQVERIILARKREWGRNPDESNSFLEREEKILEMNDEINQGRRLYFKAFSAYGGGLKKQTNILLEAAQNPYFNGEIKLKTISAKAYVSVTRFYFSLFESDISQAAMHLTDTVQLLESYPSLLMDNIKLNIFSAAVFNLSLMQITENKFDNAEATILKIRGKKSLQGRSPITYFEKNTKYEIAISRKKLDFERGESAISEILPFSRKRKGQLDKGVEIELRHMAAIFYLNFDLPKKALRWIIENKDERIENVRSDILGFSRLLFLITHYDLGNWDVIETGLRSARTFFSKQDRNATFEFLILDFFKEILKSKDNRGQMTILQQFRKDLLVYFQVEGGKWNHYFNLKAWVLAKIENREMKFFLKKYFIDPKSLDQ